MRKFNEMELAMEPKKAWEKYISPYVGDPKWLEDGTEVSKKIKLSKREICGLVVLCHLLNDKFKGGYVVAYDAGIGEPNDGMVTNGQFDIIQEHKIVPNRKPTEVLDDIIRTYKANQEKGEWYGKNRTLVIQANKAASHGGMINISKLREEINGDTFFERVYSLGVVKYNMPIAIFSFD